LQKGTVERRKTIRHMLSFMALIAPLFAKVAGCELRRKPFELVAASSLLFWLTVAFGILTIQESFLKSIWYLLSIQQPEKSCSVSPLSRTIRGLLGSQQAFAVTGFRGKQTRIICEERTPPLSRCYLLVVTQNICDRTSLHGEQYHV